MTKLECDLVAIDCVEKSLVFEKISPIKCATVFTFHETSKIEEEEKTVY